MDGELQNFVARLFLANPLIAVAARAELDTAVDRFESRSAVTAIGAVVRSGTLGKGREPSWIRKSGKRDDGLSVASRLAAIRTVGLFSQEDLRFLAEAASAPEAHVRRTVVDFL